MMRRSVLSYSGLKYYQKEGNKGEPMRKGQWLGKGGIDGWNQFCREHACAERGADRMEILKSLDEYLERQGKEVVTIDVSSADIFFRIENRE
jgi:hypothetical protein